MPYKLRSKSSKANRKGSKQAVQDVEMHEPSPSPEPLSPLQEAARCELVKLHEKRRQQCVVSWASNQRSMRDLIKQVDEENHSQTSRWLFREESKAHRHRQQQEPSTFRCPVQIIQIYDPPDPEEKRKQGFTATLLHNIELRIPHMRSWIPISVNCWRDEPLNKLPIEVRHKPREIDFDFEVVQLDDDIFLALVEAMQRVVSTFEEDGTESDSEMVGSGSDSEMMDVSEEENSRSPSPLTEPNLMKALSGISEEFPWEGDEHELLERYKALRGVTGQQQGQEDTARSAEATSEQTDNPTDTTAAEGTSREQGSSDCGVRCPPQVHLPSVACGPSCCLHILDEEDPEMPTLEPMNVEPPQGRGDKENTENALSLLQQLPGGEADKPQSDEDSLPGELEAPLLSLPPEPRCGTWSPTEKSLLRMLLDLMPRLTACNLARLLPGKTCQQVFRYVGEVAQVPHPCPGEISEPSWYQPEERRVYDRIRRGMNHYYPCEHPGEPCDEHCTCIKTHNFCDKFCGCTPQCRNRFRVCRCKGRCNPRQCSCYKAQRECDPDRCPCCVGAKRDFSKMKCKNIGLLFNQRKEVMVLPSRVAGWGGFLVGGAKQNELIGEFVGEVVIQEDAEKRGMVYDSKEQPFSYLFDLDSDFTLDALNFGNTQRFINHSLETPNCYPRVMVVNGEQRIGIYAKHDIGPRLTELFFDYGYENAQRTEFVAIEPGVLPQLESEDEPE